MNEIQVLKSQVESLTRELEALRAFLPYKTLGNAVEFDKILVAKNRLIIPEKSQDTTGRNGEIIISGVHGYLRVNDTWKQIT